MSKVGNALAALLVGAAIGAGVGILLLLTKERKHASVSASP